MIGVHESMGGAKVADWIKAKADDLIKYRQIAPPTAAFKTPGDEESGILDVDALARKQRASAKVGFSRMTYVKQISIRGWVEVRFGGRDAV